MGLFDKITQNATNLGKNVVNSTANLGASVVTAAQEQNELVQLKSQVNVIEQELNALYAQVGRRYIDYVLETGDMPGVDASDLLKLLDPKLTKKLELEQKIVELEKEIKDKQIAREKQTVEKQFISEKSKLDRALAMDVLTQEEYDIKLAMAKKKVDNFEEIRRVKQQANMGLITNEERDAKIKSLTE
jgi:hypothetical protein